MSSLEIRTYIKGFPLKKETIVKLLSDAVYFEGVKSGYVQYNTFTEFNGRCNYYCLTSEGKPIVTRELVNLALFDIGADGWGEWWHTNDYNRALFELSIPVRCRKKQKGHGSGFYAEAIKNNLLIYEYINS